MARPKSLSNLSLADLEKMMSAKRGELEKLAQQREKLQIQLAEVDARIAKIGGASVGAPEAGEAPAKRGRRGRRTRVRNTVSLGDAIFSALNEEGGPLPVGTIMERVQASGYKSNAGNFRAILNQMLIKDKRFVAKDRGVYQIKK